jgi:hypothetical protein
LQNLLANTCFSVARLSGRPYRTARLFLLLASIQQYSSSSATYRTQNLTARIKRTRYITCQLPLADSLHRQLRRGPIDPDILLRISGGQLYPFSATLVQANHICSSRLKTVQLGEPQPTLPTHSQRPAPIRTQQQQSGFARFFSIHQPPSFTARPLALTFPFPSLTTLGLCLTLAFSCTLSGSPIPITAAPHSYGTLPTNLTWPAPPNWQAQASRGARCAAAKV